MSIFGTLGLRWEAIAVGNETLRLVCITLMSIFEAPGLRSKALAVGDEMRRVV